MFKERNTKLLVAASLNLVLIILFGLAELSDAETFSYTATDTPMPINTYTDVYSTISITHTRVITDLNVFVDLDHTWLNNLDIWVGHNGIWVQLFNNHGGDKDDIMDVTFDDEATEHINDIPPRSSPPAYGPGVFKPTSIPQTGYSSLLSAFDGISLEGDWTLWIYDGLLTGANGTLHTFRIEGTAEGWKSAYDSLLESQSDLEVLRNYRDQSLTQTANGKFYTRLLYNNSGKALAVLLDNPELLLEANALIQTNIDAVSDILDGYEGVIYNTNEIVAFLDAYAKKAPPILKILAYIVRWDMLRKQRRAKLFFGFRLK